MTIADPPAPAPAPGLERARTIAEAVLMEGYALYPYRASAPKNRFRWAFGVAMPRAWSEASGEPWLFETQLLVSGEAPRLVGELRAFQIERRRIEQRGEHGFEQLDALEVDGKLEIGWDEGVQRTVDFAIAPAQSSSVELPLVFGARTLVEPVCDNVRRVRERVAITGELSVAAELLIGVAPGQTVWRVTIRVENHTPWTDPRAPREQAVTGALASIHLVLGVTGGELISLMDPPAWATQAVLACRQRGLYTVLAGAPGSHDLALISPFILNDHPQIAPESYGDFCDGSEIDEMLTLRTLTLTDDEKREARATDPRSAAIIERTDALPPEWRTRLHGALRDVHAAEMVPRPFCVGQRVRLKAGIRTDAQDLLYAGMLATIQELKPDVDGTLYLALTVDNDPAAELHDWYGRYHHYRADEVERVDPDPVA